MSKITITAGHSNTDPGACANGYKEAELATELRNILVSKLRALGHEVVADGAGTTNQNLTTAISLIKGSAVAVEIHFNAATATAKGVETIALPKHKVLSQKLSKAIADVLGTTLRGDKGFIDQTQSARGKLDYVNAGGLIVEICFITNKIEMTAYQDKKWLVASAIAKTLDEWVRQ